ncbi:hypothetical protein RKE30_34355 [Streptomyces sp. Li-HN-5-11]|uniref:hypothetical protein n=1 Tax=Streptomyces sp. Li-HN-5-11 TaxID=3075432 RepID=UPI0028B20C87|nr:hypothetical protein [Streptomyces sp. Li-HN-5-11]WNM35087.1 hypothetical protein RKE30_34355 [Streptomyces sp. Li-HN-5-11]
MLARLPLPCLLLMAAFATFLLGLEMDRWMKVRKLTWWVVAVSVACCLGMVLVGSVQHQHWNARQMLVLYSFVWAGIAVGLFPSGRILSEWCDEWRRGERRDHYEYPARYQAAVYASVIVMGFLGFLLAN